MSKCFVEDYVKPLALNNTALERKLGLRLPPHDKTISLRSPRGTAQSIVQTIAEAKRSGGICHHAILWSQTVYIAMLVIPWEPLSLCLSDTNINI